MRTEIPSESGSVASLAAPRAAHHGAAIRGHHDGPQMQFVALDLAEGANRHLASTFQCREQRPFGRHRGVSTGMIQPMHQTLDIAIFIPRLDGQRTLADCRTHHFDRNQFRNAIRPSETPESRGSQ